MKNPSQKIQLFVSMILFVFSCLAFFFLFREIRIKNKASEEKLTEWKTEFNHRDEIKSLNNSIKIVENEKALLETHFAQSSNIVPFLDTIEGLATKVDVKAEITSVEILKSGAGLVVGVKSLGYFDAMYKFINLLENSPYELEFISFDIQKQASASVSLIDKGATTKTSKIPQWSGVFKIKLLSFIK